MILLENAEVLPCQYVQVYCPARGSFLRGEASAAASEPDYLLANVITNNTKKRAIPKEPQKVHTRTCAKFRAVQAYSIRPSATPKSGKRTVMISEAYPVFNDTTQGAPMV